MHVTHEPAEGPVAHLSPFCYLRGKPAAWAKKIETTHSGRVEEFHQDSGCDRSKLALSFLIIAQVGFVNERGVNLAKHNRPW